MKKFFLFAAAVMALSMASCSNSKEGANAANDESVVGATDGLQTDATSSEAIMGVSAETTADTSDATTESEDTLSVGDHMKEAAKQTGEAAKEVYEKSKGAVTDTYAKSKEAVTNTYEKSKEAVTNAATTTYEKSKEAVKKAADKTADEAKKILNK